MADDDSTFSRRAFVKGCAVAGAAGAGIAGGLSMAKPLSIQGATRRVDVNYLAAKKVGGPAPRGIPILPLNFASDGTLEGSPTLGGESVLDWYKYCGHEDTDGLQEDYEPQDEKLVYPPDKGGDRWFADYQGEPMKKEHFEEVNQGAPVRWRSYGKEGNNIISAVVLKVDPESIAFEGVDQALVEEAGLAEGFVGFVTFCTHFCCVPGWKHAPEQAKPRNAWDNLFCTCHYSVYDPFTLTDESYVLKKKVGETSPLKPGAKQGGGGEGE
jgi:Rieske Fe-S protein